MSRPSVPDRTPVTAGQRIAPTDVEPTDPDQAAVIARAKSRYGWVPNNIRVMAVGTHAGAAQLYLTAGEVNSRSSLSGPERELIAILVASRNGCDYCYLAHPVAASIGGMSPETITAAPRVRGDTARNSAILEFARDVMDLGGMLFDEQVNRARHAGLTDAELIDIVAVVVENTLGNMINNLAQTSIDGRILKAAASIWPEER
jgi:uncharacterized peroxidase-related enzyme